MADDAAVLAAKTELRRFLADLEDLLEGSLVEYPELFGVNASRLAEVWPEVKAQSEVVKTALVGTGPDGKKLTPEETADLDDRLSQHGLTGDQLALKLAIFRSAAADFLAETAPQAEAEAFWRTWIVRLRGSSLLESALRSSLVRRLERLTKAGRELLSGRLKRALDAANVIVDSLALALSFLPGVGLAAGAFGEFKKAADVALGEPDDAEKPKRRASPGEDSNTAFGRLRSSLGL